MPITGTNNAPRGAIDSGSGEAEMTYREIVEMAALTIIYVAVSSTAIYYVAACWAK